MFKLILLSCLLVSSLYAAPLDFDSSKVGFKPKREISFDTEAPFAEATTITSSIDPLTAAPVVDVVTAAPFVDTVTAAPVVDVVTSAPFVDTVTVVPVVDVTTVAYGNGYGESYKTEVRKKIFQ